MFRFLSVCLLGLLVQSVFAADRDLEIAYEPVFLATAQPQYFAPLLIRCENKGKNTQGVFTVSSGSDETRYPVNLPQGSKKEFIVYLPSSYEAIYGTLTTDIGTAKIKLPDPSGVQNCLVSISDVDGILNFTKDLKGGQDPRMQGGTFMPMSAKPSLLPDRSPAYMSVSGVFLSDGAQNMSDTSFKALERYVLLGGTVVVTGGASTPLFNDPRWKPLLPVLNPHPETVSPEVGESVAGLRLEGKFTMSRGDMARGSVLKSSYKNKPFVVSKPYGFGRVVFIAVNIFENPVSKFDGKGELINSLNLGETGTRLNSIQAIAMMGSEDPYSRYGGGMYYPASSSPYGSPAAGDPFSASVPPTATVIWILIAYFLLVVPINLLVLRKLGRGELAWITSPLLSIGFAAVFFRFAAGLYSADLSAASSGVVIADERSPDGYFIGGSQLFFPRGGHYDLKLSNVEAIRNRNSSSYGYGGFGGMESQGLKDFDPVDNGHINVTDLSVSNLTFREFGYYQALKGEWLAVTPVGKNSVQVTNRSKSQLTGASLYFEKGVADVGELKPGQSRKVRLENSGVPRNEDGMSMESMGLSSMVSNQAKKGRIVVVGQINNFRPGPQIGNLAPQNSKLRLIWFGRVGG